MLLKIIDESGGEVVGPFQADRIPSPGEVIVLGENARFVVSDDSEPCTLLSRSPATGGVSMITAITVESERPTSRQKRQARRLVESMPAAARPESTK